MSNSNATIRFDSTDKAGLKKVETLHDEHSQDYSHGNDTIVHADTSLNTFEHLYDIDEAVHEQWGDFEAQKLDKLDKNFEAGKISAQRYQERTQKAKDYLKGKKIYALGVCYIGDEDQTRQKLDDLGFSYEEQQVKGQDGLMHTHFHLTDKEQRKQWSKICHDTFLDVANKINSKPGIKICEMVVHMDEASPHAHFKAVKQGHTDKGMPSYNLNQALSDFNLSLGIQRQRAKVTKKTKHPRISGSATLHSFHKAFDKEILKSFNDVLKQEGFSTSYTFKHKGKKARALNQLDPKIYKTVKAAEKDLREAYKAVRGREPVGKDGEPLTLRELSKGLKRASKQAKKEKIGWKDLAKRLVEYVKDKLSDLITKAYQDGYKAGLEDGQNMANEIDEQYKTTPQQQVDALTKLEEERQKNSRNRRERVAEAVNPDMLAGFTSYIQQGDDHAEDFGVKHLPKETRKANDELKKKVAKDLEDDGPDL